jgi:hypothetical protein
VTWMAAGSNRNKEEKECFLSSQIGSDFTDYQMADRSMTPNRWVTRNEQPQGIKTRELRAP